MSSSTRFVRIAASVSTLVGAVAIVAAAWLGMTGYPPSEAHASASGMPNLLGVDSGDVVRLGTEVPAAAKVDVALTASLAASAPLATPAVKAKAPVPKPVAPKQSAKRSYGSKGGSGIFKAAKGWRRARVSWYGPGFYGNTMAGGGKLQKNSMVVAHRSMPFGTKIVFKYKGRSVTAVVKDRGPYVSGREFDLGPGTAKALGFSGVGTVEYKIIGR